MILPGQVPPFIYKYIYIQKTKQKGEIREFAFRINRIPAAHKPVHNSTGKQAPEKLLILDTIRPHTHISFKMSSRVTVAALNLSTQ